MTDPAPRPSNNPTGRKTVTAAQKRAQAVTYRKAGKTFQEIADLVGFTSKATAYNAVKRALEDAVREPAQELIQLETERLDAMLAGLWPAIEQGDTQAVNAGIRVSERGARLLGLDAAQAVTMSGPGGGPIPVDVTGMTPEERRTQLEQLVVEAQRRLRTSGTDATGPVDAGTTSAGS